MDNFKAARETIEMLSNQVQKLEKEKRDSVSKMKGNDKIIFEAYEKKLKFDKSISHSEMMDNLQNYSVDYVTCMKFSSSIQALPDDAINEALKVGEINDKHYFKEVLNLLKWA